MKYIDADRLQAEIERRMTENCKLAEKVKCFGDRAVEDNDILALIDSLQQDKETLELCSQVWWQDRGWIMIPPNVTLSGIESLLNQIKRKRELGQDEEQKQPEVDLEEYIENEINHYGLSLYEASYGTFSASQIDRIIRNAFELGLKARKV